MRAVMLNSLMFILGFTIVFIVLGAVASTLGQITRQYYGLLTRLAQSPTIRTN